MKFFFCGVSREGGSTVANHEINREEIRQVLIAAMADLRAIRDIHPEALDIPSILELQRGIRQTLVDVERLAAELLDDDDPIITDD